MRRINIYKAHFSFLEFTTDDQLDELFPEHRLQDDPMWTGDNHVFWAMMYFGNCQLAEDEDNDDENAEAGLRAVSGPRACLVA